MIDEKYTTDDSLHGGVTHSSSSIDDDLIDGALVPRSQYLRSTADAYKRITSDVTSTSQAGKFFKRTQFLSSSYAGEQYVLSKPWVVPMALNEAVYAIADGKTDESKDLDAGNLHADANTNILSTSNDHIKEDDTAAILIDADRSKCGYHLAFGEEIYSLPDPFPSDKHEEKRSEMKDGFKGEAATDDGAYHNRQKDMKADGSKRSRSNSPDSKGFSRYDATERERK